MERAGYEMNRNQIDLFVKDVHDMGIDLSTKQIDQFIAYYEMLIEWNKKMNLTAITDFEDVLKKHFVDSLSIAKIIDLSHCNSLIDIGTGAGFPGIPIKIAFPEIKVTLLDSLQKRIYFLDAVIEKLDLEKIETIHGRAEDYAKPGILRESFDLCVSRAVANLSSLSELCIPFVKTGGMFVAYKSEKAAEELEFAQNAFKCLHINQVECIQVILSDTYYKRNLIKISKEERTPSKYPRKSGMPIKQPL